MKVSLNWAQYYSNVDVTKIGVDELTRKIGAQLGAIEEVVNWGSFFEGVVVARVVSCQAHPNADKLRVCTIDDGGNTVGVNRDENRLIQVVCGAPNVKEGMLVAWLPPGSTVPSTRGKEPLVLEARDIRGVVSNGMLASAHELGISDDHTGILEINKDEPDTEKAEPGLPFKELYSLDDVVVDIENKMFTHRPDLFGVLGVARELAGIQGLSFKSPDWYTTPTKIKLAKTSNELRVENQAPDKVPRFATHLIENIVVGPSPMWLQATLKRSGIRPINNVVDISNYYMQLTAQPTHAFDYDKLKSVSGAIPALMPRMAHDGEELRLLNGKVVKLTKDDIVIATDKKVVALAGIMGGAETEVDESTTSIVVEAATFDMYSIRRSSMHHGLFSDAVTRFTKGQSPHQNTRVLAKLAQDLEQAGARPTDKVADIQAKLQPPITVHATAEFINSRLGLDLDTKVTAELLSNVEFDVRINGPTLAVTPPFWRTDIEIAEDVVEEVGRLYGYDQLPLQLPLRDIRPVPKSLARSTRNTIRRLLASAGANELLTYSFVHGGLLDKVGQDKAHAFQLANALSPDLQYYRLSLTPNLLEKVHPNIKAGYEKLALFELGTVHMKGVMDQAEPSVPQEDTHLAMVLAYDNKARPPEGAAFYGAKQYMSMLLPRYTTSLVPLESFDFGSDEWGRQLAAPYHPARSGVIVRDGLIQGVVGEFKPSVCTALKLPSYTAGFEIALDMFTDLDSPVYTPIPRFPKTEQDICLRVPAEVSFGELEQLVHQVLAANAKNAKIDIVPLDIYQRPTDPAHKQITFRIVIASHEKTLVAAETNSLLEHIASQARQQFKAERV